MGANVTPVHVQAVKARASHTDWIAAIAWHPQSAHHLATASHDATVKLWDTRAAVPLHTISSHTDKVCGLMLVSFKRRASGKVAPAGFTTRHVGGGAAAHHLRLHRQGLSPVANSSLLH